MNEKCNVQASKIQQRKFDYTSHRLNLTIFIIDYFLLSIQMDIQLADSILFCALPFVTKTVFENQQSFTLNYGEHYTLHCQKHTCKGFLCHSLNINAMCTFNGDWECTLPVYRFRPINSKLIEFEPNSKYNQIHHFFGLIIFVWKFGDLISKSKTSYIHVHYWSSYSFVIYIVCTNLLLPI